MPDSNDPQGPTALREGGQDATMHAGQTQGEGTPGPTAHTGAGDGPQPVEPVAIHIQLGRQDIEVSPTQLHDGTLTGRQIRALATPPIGADRDLFEIVPGGSDRKIGDGDTVVIRDHLRFFSAPTNINPGASARRFSVFCPRRHPHRRGVRSASR